MKQGKALFFDIDGTITCDMKETIPEITISALELARQNGHYLFLNTGRTLCNISQKLHDLEFDGLLLGCGTYNIFRGEVIRKSSIPEERGYELVRELMKCNVGILLEGTEGLYFPKDTAPYPEMEVVRKRSEEWGILTGTCVEDFDYVYDKLLLCLQPDSDVKRIYEICEKDLDVIDRHGGVLEVVQKGFTKATAIEDIRKFLGLTMDDIYVFGDSSNDEAMFAYATHTIAMGDHDPELEPLTEYVTGKISEGGIYQAMEHYGLI